MLQVALLPYCVALFAQAMAETAFIKKGVTLSPAVLHKL